MLCDHGFKPYFERTGLLLDQHGIHDSKIHIDGLESDFYTKIPNLPRLVPGEYPSHNLGDTDYDCDDLCYTRDEDDEIEIDGHVPSDPTDFYGLHDVIPSGMQIVEELPNMKYTK